MERKTVGVPVSIENSSVPTFHDTVLDGKAYMLPYMKTTVLYPTPAPFIILQSSLQLASFFLFEKITV